MVNLVTLYDVGVLRVRDVSLLPRVVCGVHQQRVDTESLQVPELWRQAESDRLPTSPGLELTGPAGVGVSVVHDGEELVHRDHLAQGVGCQ